MFEEEPWDEERWESFLQENDRRVSRYMELFLRFLSAHPMPDRKEASALQYWEAQLRAYLTEKGFEDLMLIPFFPPEELDQDGEQAETDEEPTFLGIAQELFEEDHDADPHTYLHFCDLPIYQQAFDLTTAVLDWAHGLPAAIKDSTLVQYCTHITQIPANIAKGHGIGYERDMIGGNIACVKRGLLEANAALHRLHEMKQAAYMDARHYGSVYERTYELRNALGLYIQELRRRGTLGID